MNRLKIVILVNGLILFVVLLIVVGVPGTAQQWWQRIFTGGNGNNSYQIGQHIKVIKSITKVVTGKDGNEYYADNLVVHSKEKLSAGSKTRVMIDGNITRRLITQGTVLYVLLEPDIKVVGAQTNDKGDDGWGVGHWFLSLRNRLNIVLSYGLEEPHAGLLSGMLLGGKQDLEYSLKTILVNSGTVHVVTASGYNLTVVMLVLRKSLEKFIRKKYLLGSLLFGVWFYTGMVGLEPAIVRAAIMCTLMLTANWTGREYLAGRSLLVTGGLMLLLNPGLINSIGFWLSITSTAGLIWLSPVVEGMVKKVEKVIKVWEVGKVGEVGKAELKVFSTFPTSPTFLTFPTFSNKYLLLVGGLFKESFVSSLSAQIVTWPILLLFFHQISWLALVVNVLVLWTIPLIMCLGLIKLFFGLFSFYLGSYGSLLVWLPLELFYKVNVLFGSASGVVIDLNNVMSIIPAEAVYIVGIAYYLMLIDMVCVVNRKKLSKN